MVIDNFQLTASADYGGCSICTWF